MILALLALFALTRAEIVQRMRSPVINQADGLVRVYANCDEDQRREYQGPIASFAAETVKTLYQGLAMKNVRFARPGIIILVGNERTNNTAVVTRVETNETHVTSRIYLQSPGYSDVERFRTELVRAFYRSVQATELSAREAVAALRAADPQLRIEDQRTELEDWLAGRSTPEVPTDLPLTEEAIFARAERMIARMRKVIEPGVASRRDVLIFASRLCLYPRTFDEKFLGGADVLSFAEAIALAKVDPRVRFLALFKAKEMPLYGGGRGEVMNDAAASYMTFLLDLAKGEKSDAELASELEVAELKLKAAYEQAE